jgi:hypothetical protein
MLVPDGVYTFEGSRARFHPVGAPGREDLVDLLRRIVTRVQRCLVTDGWLVADAEQPWLDLEPTDGIDALRAASIRYRIALGPHAWHRTLTLMDPALARSAPAEKPFTTNLQGFSLNAAVACAAHQRDRLERLCCYVTRPAIALDRPSVSPFGEVRLALKRPCEDGTTHVRFTFATGCQHHGSAADLGTAPYRAKSPPSRCRVRAGAGVRDRDHGVSVLRGSAQNDRRRDGPRRARPDPRARAAGRAAAGSALGSGIPRMHGHRGGRGGSAALRADPRLRNCALRVCG